VLFALPASAWAQQGAVRAAPPAPAAAAAAAPPAAAPATGETDPVVRAVLEANPTTPSELIHSARLLVEYKRPQLARDYLKKVLDARLGVPEFIALVNEFGSEAFLELGTRRDLAPEGRQLATLALEATRRRVQDPQRIAALIAQLEAPSLLAREEALVQLQQAQMAAVIPMTEILADPQRVAQHPRIEAALAQMGIDALGPLVGMLDSKDPQVVVRAIRVLGNLSVPGVSIYLLAPAHRASSTPEVRAAAEEALKRHLRLVPAASRSVTVLTDTARRHFDRIQPLAADSTGLVPVWCWSEAQKRLVLQRFETDDAHRRFAVRFARDAYQIAPEDRNVLAFYVTVLLEHLAYENGLDQPLPADHPLAARIAKFDAPLLDSVIAMGMTGEHAPAANAAVQLLALQPTADRLLTRSANPASLVVATRHANRRLRLSAAETIVRMQPAGQFPGASWVTDGLGFLASSSGSRRVLLAGARAEDFQRVTGYLFDMGYETHAAGIGRDLLRQAIASADFEMILVDAGIDRPTIEYLIQELRRDGRTAALPVAILARTESLDLAERIAGQSPRTAAFAYPYEATDARWQIDRVAKLGQGGVLPVDERLRQAARSLELLGQLAADPRQDYFDVRRTEDVVIAALNVPALSSRAVAVLPHMKSPRAQQTLLTIASRSTAPLALRQAALRGFRQTVQRQGLLLTTREIQGQYDRYNQSAGEDPATQDILGKILDCIEAPTAPLQPAKDAAKGQVARRTTAY
jgi:hypothetical protein